MQTPARTSEFKNLGIRAKHPNYHLTQTSNLTSPAQRTICDNACVKLPVQSFVHALSLYRLRDTASRATGHAIAPSRHRLISSTPLALIASMTPGSRHSRLPPSRPHPLLKRPRIDPGSTASLGNPTAACIEQELAVAYVAMALSISLGGKAPEGRLRTWGSNRTPCHPMVLGEWEGRVADLRCRTGSVTSS